MKSGAIFGYFLVAALLVSVFFINRGVSSTLLEQKNGWSFTTSTRDTSPPALVGSDTGYSLTAGQNLNVSWSSTPSGLGQTISMRFYLLNSSQISGWRWVVTPRAQYEETNSGYLIKLDNWATTVTCPINSTDTYYVIFVCNGVYNPIDFPPEIYVYSYAAYASSPPSVSVTPGSVALDFGQSQLFTSNVSDGTSPYSYQWYLSTAILGNTIVNPGFETGDFTGWNQEGINNASIRNDEHHSGSYCSASAYNGSPYYLYLPFKITQRLPGVLSDFVTSVGCWIKYGISSIDWLRVNYTDGSVSSIGLGASGDWTHVTLNLMANKIVDSLILERNASSGYGIWIDDVEFSVNGGPVSGATGSTWTFTPSSSGSYTVYVQVTDNAGFSANSNFATVTVDPVPSVAVTPSSVVMDVGQSQPFNSTVSGGLSPYSYQWVLNDTPVSGATYPTWAFTPSSSGSYNIYLNVTDNVGFTAESNIAYITVNPLLFVSVSPASVVMDVGQSQLFNSTFSGGTSPYSCQWVLGKEKPPLLVLVPGATNATWAFTPSSTGSYTVSVLVNDSVGMQSSSNTVAVAVHVHDVAITNITLGKTVVGQGYGLNLTVTAADFGDYAETFNVTVYANTSSFASQNVALLSGNSTTIMFTWSTTGFAYGNYTIRATAGPVSGETDTANNNYSCPIPVHVGVPGDVSGTTPGVYDGVVNVKDVAYMVALTNTKPGSSNWNPNADVNNDGVVNVRDIAIAVAYFNQHA